MSPPKFLTDEDFRDAIVAGVLRRAPQVDFVSVRATRVRGRPDPEVLELAQEENRILLTHDVNTMTGHAYDRVAAGLSFPGMFVVPQRMPISAAVAGVIVVWAQTDAAQWRDRVEFFPPRLPP